MNTQHTPGPWFYNPYRSTISQQDPRKPREDGKKRIAILYDTKEVEFSKTDAILMATAPELLETCEALMDLISRCYISETPTGFTEDLDDAKAVIAKAKGEQQKEEK